MLLKVLGRIELAVAALLLVMIVVLVFFAAILRFFGHPLIWSVDLAQLLFIWLCMIGATRALRTKSHLGIDLVVRHLPHRLRFWLEMGLSLLILAFLAVLAVEGFRLTLGNLQRRFGDSGISYGWVTSAVPVGSILLMVALGYNMAMAWQKRRDGETLVYSRSATEMSVPTEL